MPSQVLVEAVAILLFLALLRTAYRNGKFDVSLLVCGALYGLLIELMFVHFAQGYEYGEFTVMVLGAPLWVSAGWGVIIYAAFLAAAKARMSDWARGPAAGLMAVSLDFALDPVAEALGWWHWKRPDPGFFGVSYDNFVGWLLIVGSFAAAVTYIKRWWGPFAALPISVAVVAGCTPVLEAVYPHTGEGIVFLVIHTAFTAAVLGGVTRAQEWYRIAVPVVFHALFVFHVLTEGLAGAATELYGVIAMASSASLLWFIPARD